MRRRYTVLLLLLPSLLLAQPDTASEVPVQRVVLFTSGVGYFEHQGSINGDTDVELRFSERTLNDVLKSLVIEDQGGRIAGVTYPSEAPIQRTLGAFAVNLSNASSLSGVLGQLRGAEVEVDSPDGNVRGTVLGVSNQQIAVGQTAVSAPILTIMSSRGLRNVRLDTAHGVQLVDPALQDELMQALGALANARSTDQKPMHLQFRDGGRRSVRFGYVIESPLWKTSYRLILPDEQEGEGTLQGWALVENPTESDWANVDLSLVSGHPVSFIQNLYTPFYVSRPVVQMATHGSVAPQRYEEGVRAYSGRITINESGYSGTIQGNVRDARTGEELPGASVVLVGTSHGASTDLDGNFSFGGVPPGSYTIQVRFIGYESVQESASLRQGRGLQVEAQLADDTIMLDEVSVNFERPLIMNDAIGVPRVVSEQEMLAGNLPTRYGDGVALQGGAIDPTAGIAATGTSGDIGEYFQYSLGQVTLPRHGSAMLPIVSDAVQVARISIYNESVMARNPMRGARLTNTSDKYLLGGPITVYDEGYAGDALLDDLKPGRDRLLSFAIDQDLLIDASPQSTGPRRIISGRIVDGTLRLQRRTIYEREYKITNRANARRTLIIEHNRQAGTNLVDTPEPIEQVGQLDRFFVELGSSAQDTLLVQEALTTNEAIALQNQNLQTLTVFAASNSGLPADVRQAIQRAITLRQAQADTEREIAALEAELAEITREQERIRGNMTAVQAGTAYYRRLLRKLDEQETRIDLIGAQIERLRETARAQNRAFRDYVRNLDID